MNGCLKVFTVYVLKQSGIDDTIEIRIIIFVEIFSLIKKHCEKKKMSKIICFKIQMIPPPPLHNFE